jgi:flagellar basal-body rod protein FlgB
MNLADIPLFAMLRSRLGYTSERQKLIAQNVANSETPGFRPRDLQPFSFQVKAAQAGGLAMTGAQAVTQASHMMSPSARRPGGGVFRERKAEVVETTLDGNGVSLEEEMLKMTDARMNYEAAIGFYQKSLGLLRMASRPPGRV